MKDLKMSQGIELLPNPNALTELIGEALKDSEDIDVVALIYDRKSKTIKVIANCMNPNDYHYKALALLELAKPVIFGSLR